MTDCGLGKICFFPLPVSSQEHRHQGIVGNRNSHLHLLHLTHRTDIVRQSGTSDPSAIGLTLLCQPPYEPDEVGFRYWHRSKPSGIAVFHPALPLRVARCDNPIAPSKVSEQGGCLVYPWSSGKRPQPFDNRFGKLKAVCSSYNYAEFTSRRRRRHFGLTFLYASQISGAA